MLSVRRNPLRSGVHNFDNWPFFKRQAAILRENHKRIMRTCKEFPYGTVIADVGTRHALQDQRRIELEARDDIMTAETAGQALIHGWGLNTTGCYWRDNKNAEYPKHV